MKKSQLSIFIVFAVIFMAGSFFVYQLKEENRAKSPSLDSSDFNQRYNIVLKRFESCLEKHTINSLVSLGYGGGFIYNTTNDNNLEKYLVTKQNPQLYDFKRLEQINDLILIPRFLVHIQRDLFFPKIDSSLIFNYDNENTTIYNKSIKDEIKRYLNLNYLNCISSKELEKDLFYTLKIDSNILEILDFKRDENFYYVQTEKIQNIESLVLNLNSPISPVNKTEELDNFFLVFNREEVDKFLLEDQSLLESYIVDESKKIDFEVDFSNNLVLVSTKSNFEITDEITGSKKEINKISFKINLPILEYVNIIQKFLKIRMVDKSSSLEDETILRSILKNYENKDDIELLKSIVKTDNNSSIYKIYSLKDNRHKLLDSSYIFNGIYFNSAPFIVGVINADFSNNFIYVDLKSNAKTIRLQVADFQDIDATNFIQVQIPEACSMMIENRINNDLIIRNISSITSCYFYLTDGEMSNRYEVITR